MAQARRIALAGGEYYSWRMQLCCIRLNSSSRKPSELSVTDISHASNPGHSRCLCARVRAPQSRARRDSLWEPQPPNAAHGGAAHQHINADGPGPHERRTSERPHLHKNFYPPSIPRQFYEHANLPISLTAHRAPGGKLRAPCGRWFSTPNRWNADRMLRPTLQRAGALIDWRLKQMFVLWWARVRVRSPEVDGTSATDRAGGRRVLFLEDAALLYPFE